MKVVALISGGKDSTYNMCKCVDDGHEIVGLANLFPPTTGSADVDEMDSFMFQTVGHQAITSIAEAMKIPLFRRAITGRPISQSMDYVAAEGDEVEDLFQLLKQVRDSGTEFDAISVGAIHSNYQRVRAEDVCNRLGIKMLAYLWSRDQDVLLREMIDYGVEAILIKTAVIGLGERHLGKRLQDVIEDLMSLKQEYGINVCGEGGEFETLTLDCPLFHQKLQIDESRNVLHSNDAFAPVYYMIPVKISLISKSGTDARKEPLIL